jgi:hypothetical protein
MLEVSEKSSFFAVTTSKETGEFLGFFETEEVEKRLLLLDATVVEGVTS